MAVVLPAGYDLSMTTSAVARSARKVSKPSTWRQRVADAGNLLRFVLLAGLFVVRSARARRRWERWRALSKARRAAPLMPNQPAPGGRGRAMRAIRPATPG
jgi:hypothetical protein